MAIKYMDQMVGNLPPEVADKVISKVNEIENELLIEVEDEEKLKAAGLINIIGARN